MESSSSSLCFDPVVASNNHKDTVYDTSYNIVLYNTRISDGNLYMFCSQKNIINTLSFLSQQKGKGNLLWALFLRETE